MQTAATTPNQAPWGTRRASRRAWLRAGAGLAALLVLAACGTAGQGAAAATSTAPTTDSATTGSATSATPSASSAAASADSATETSAPAATAASAGATAAATSSADMAAATSESGATSSASSAVTTSAAPSAAPGSTTAAAAAGKGVKLALDATGNQASYQVQEQLAGHDFPSNAVGKTSAVSGAIVLDGAGKIVAAQSKLELDLRTLQSDQSMRDHYIQNDPLQTSEYPTATFVPQRATGMPWPLPATGAAKFTLAGDMTLHGATKPMTWAVDATFAGDKVTGTASSPFTFTEFGMQPPRTMIALSVQNNGTLALQFAATKATA